VQLKEGTMAKEMKNTQRNDDAADGAKSAGATKGRFLVVTAKQDSRWRAGRQFGREPVAIPIGELNEAQRAAIDADPVLIAVEEDR
jgi:hypothetical protein